MADAVLRIQNLPDSALDAAGYFHARVLPEIRSAHGERPDIDLVVAFDPAGYEHRAWRLAVIQQLAREHAPARVNGLVSNDDNAIAAARRYLSQAKGVTGQLLALDSNGAGAVL